MISSEESAPSASRDDDLAQAGLGGCRARLLHEGGYREEHLALQARSCLAISSAVKSGFTVVITAPSRAAPWKAIGYSSVFGE
jgi:hypothetical protein